MSRHLQTVEQPASLDKILAETCVNFIADHSVPRHVTCAEISDATTQDHAVQHCMKAVEHDNWNNMLDTVDKQVKAELQSLHNVHNELTISQDQKCPF